jgi:hypothetical protein
MVINQILKNTFYVASFEYFKGNVPKLVSPPEYRSSPRPEDLSWSDSCIQAIRYPVSFQENSNKNPRQLGIFTGKHFIGLTQNLEPREGVVAP